METAKELKELEEKVRARYPEVTTSVRHFLGGMQWMDLKLGKHWALVEWRSGPSPIFGISNNSEGEDVGYTHQMDERCFDLDETFERVCEILKKTPTEHMTELKEKILAAVPDARVGLMPSFDAVICFLDIQHGKRFIEARYDFGGFGVCDCSTPEGASHEGPTERPADLEATAKRVLELLAKQEESPA